MHNDLMVRFNLKTFNFLKARAFANAFYLKVYATFL